MTINELPIGQCCGCETCVQICPKNAISFQEKSNGFSYPKINLDSCVNCGICAKSCPILSLPKVSREMISGFGATNVNEEIRLRSSSGGIFYALAEDTIKNEGVVFGVKFNEKFEPIYTSGSTLDEVRPMMGSKYIQARIGTAYKDVESHLRNGKKVLFVGTPCQIAGLKSFLRIEYEGLLMVEIVCHGVPSPKRWREYLASHNGEVIGVNFRDKRNGWKAYNTTITFKNKPTYSVLHNNNPFMREFLEDKILRPSCYNCDSKHYANGADITMGDFWGISAVDNSKTDNKGLSVVYANTQKGLNVLLGLKSVTLFNVTGNPKAKMYNGGFLYKIGNGERKNLPKNNSKKTGIITLHFNGNYGGIIQSYALCQTLKKMGKNPVVLTKGEIGYPSGKEYVPTQITVDYGKLQEKDFDSLVVGSDQIWRPMYAGDPRRYFLAFAEKWRIPKVAYAPSFGSDSWEYSQQATSIAKQYAKTFTAISVREDSGVELCKNKLGVKAQHVVDPTMLLSPQDYVELIEKKYSEKVEYGIYAYILDDTEQKEKLIKDMSVSLAEQTKIIKDRTAQGKHPSMEEWLCGFHKSKCVITDSFHGCVFSIIFNKPFVVFNNVKRGNGRITSLLRMFGLEDRLINPASINLDVLQKLLTTPLDVEDKMKEEREKGITFLRTNLNGNKG